MMAQTATQVAPATPATGDKQSAGACCSGDRCPMGKDGKLHDGNSCCNHGCCKDGKCDMAARKNAKGRCGDKCPIMKGASRRQCRAARKALPRAMQERLAVARSRQQERL
jgi:hypothetical protein